MRYYVKCSFRWGKFIIRRLGDSECITLLPQSMPNKDGRLTRYIIALKGENRGKIKWTSKQPAREVKFRNPDTTEAIAWD
jgi:hypothetical protein